MLAVEERVAAIQERVRAACVRCGREPAEVGIVAVAKRYGPDAVTGVAACGLTVFGENRIQEAKQKIPLCPGHLEWHLVGHLQSNKVRDAISLFHMIHSVDSLRLLETVDRLCGEAGKRLPVCLQVNVSGEGSKFGMDPTEVAPTLEAATAFMNVEVEGLMTMPPFTEDPEGSRPVFRRLRDVRDEVRDRTGVALEALSMGMSNDFDVAIEEGATWIRVGTLLFGERERNKQE